MNDNDTKKDNKNFLKYKAKIDEIFKNQKGNQFLFFLEKKKNRLSKKVISKIKKKDEWNIPSNEIEKEKEIGRGTYGIVYKAKVFFILRFISKIIPSQKFKK